MIAASTQRRPAPRGAPKAWRGPRIIAGALVDEAGCALLDESGRWDVAPAAIDDELRQRLEALGPL
jgi:hypothetical protein